MMRFEDVRHELTALFRCYPRFVTSKVDDLEIGEIPVFVFHTIIQQDFEEQLEYLVTNDYRTLTLPEFIETLAGHRPPGRREVLLTFDDARSSFWSFAYPLLKKYELKGTLFAITGWTPDADVRWNLEDVWAGRLTRDQLQALDPDDRGVCSWSELRQMHNSGIVSVDSHSHLHRRVFVDKNLQSLIMPDSDFSPSNATHSPYLSHRQSPLHLSTGDFVGLPLFAVRGFFEDGPIIRLQVDSCDEFRTHSQKIIARSEPRTRAKDLDELRNLIPRSSFEQVSAERAREEMTEELSLARDTLRSRLGDPHAGRTMCLPFTLGGEAVIKLARDLGLDALFWGVAAGRRVNRPGLDPMRLVRLKNDFIFRLPGTGRKPVAKIYAGKLSRRVAGIRPY